MHINVFRLIPRLDIKGPNLVKGVHLEGLRVLGKPEEFSKLYYEQGADELIFQDTVASLYQRNNLKEIVTRTAENIFIPLTVAGGIRNLNDIDIILRAGADKIAVNTAAVGKPDFINQASRKFGSSTIVIAIEALRQKDKSYLAYTDNGREFTGVDVLTWAKEVEQRGAGEILLTSIDREGTGKGFDIDLVKMVSEAVNIPVIAHGGASSNVHIKEALKDGGADGVALSSMLHYSAIKNNSDLNRKFTNEGNVEFMNNNKTYKMFGSKNIFEIKKWLINNEILLRKVD